MVTRCFHTPCCRALLWQVRLLLWVSSAVCVLSQQWDRSNIQTRVGWILRYNGKEHVDIKELGASSVKTLVIDSNCPDRRVWQSVCKRSFKGGSVSCVLQSHCARSDNPVAHLCLRKSSWHGDHSYQLAHTVSLTLPQENVFDHNTVSASSIVWTLLCIDIYDKASCWPVFVQGGKLD